MVIAGDDVVGAIVVSLVELVEDVLDSSEPLSDPPHATVMVLTANAAAIAAVTESRREIRVCVMFSARLLCVVSVQGGCPPNGVTHAAPVLCLVSRRGLPKRGVVNITAHGSLR
ncbi:hypothetical protein GCM10023114_54220 [Mycolicibacterium sediminis]|uniref:Uncharacterized protein n=1 Tax=Mycolicibacterium sediminis TaxID=1286180 RepID=A0A7I7QKL7_9MYCO|nr:hypothetical protein MSEDJ_09200 [Mycolicibacterium sediminis]